jgi:crotonobetainyl-CoA:carnitine CoA-transferase CaiB-like acyl-CoA transferase
VMGAISGLVGTLVALYWRDANRGEGQLIDASIYEGLLPLIASSLATWQEGEPPPKRMGSRMPATIPRNAYCTKDGRWVALSASTDAQIARILELFGIDTPENRARFGTMEARQAHELEMDALMRDWLLAHDCATAVAKLTEARISVGEINDLKQVVDDPQFKARESITRFEDPNLGTIKTPAPAPKLTKTPGRIARPAPQLGEHSEAVCREWLGMAGEEIEALKRAKAI